MAAAMALVVLRMQASMKGPSRRRGNFKNFVETFVDFYSLNEGPLQKEGQSEST
ncbi:Hypothetical protein PFR_JS21-2_1961 [Propionibacterium freudenreichii]|nr:Hypothetical protein PFR_JS4_1649 [Propionibacterium freudenreichii]SCQ57493.1 Hypothetical protein PFR_JS21-1_1962 [Propionibacterium freudenreichii]SCQ60955.1 Hypothetical protein PFR_JS25-1_1813 [Propionibacterium freudenreichii]SCQ65226.1 Hypothetical protein PFR_JS21-2_1961 [Propionibacterium freudenreichii]